MNRMFAKIAAVLCAAATPVMAQTAWYMGAGIGQSRTSNDLVANRESTVVNATVTSSEFDSKDTGYRVFGGYRVNPWLSVEANYADLGQSRLRTNTLTSTPGEPSLPGSVVLNRNISGFGADLLVSAPLGPSGSVFARLGVVRARTEAEATLSGALVFTSGDPTDRKRTTTVDETVARYGFGGDWMFTPNMGARLEWERWPKVGKAFAIGGTGTTGEADTDFYSLSLIYRF